MKELLIVGALAVVLFTVAYYQSYRDKRRWKRIVSGMSLFGDRPNIPPLVLDGRSFDSHDRHVMVIWADRKRSAFETVHDARQRVEREKQAGKAMALGAMIYAWDGQSWKQRN